MIKSKVQIVRKYYDENENQFGDLRIPPSSGPFPVAVVIHGGFWRDGVSLEIMNDFAEELVKEGIATWNIEYRRVGQEGGGWPGTFIDVSKAIDYLNKLSKDYPLDLNNIITVGHSAGGQLAFWLAARHKSYKLKKMYENNLQIKIKAAISLAGVNDLELMNDIHEIRESVTGNKDNPIQDLLGEDELLSERLKEVSPIELLPIGIPLFLVHGSLDVGVPIGMSENFKTLAEKSGDNVFLKRIPNAEHFKIIYPKYKEWKQVLEVIKSSVKLNDK